MGRSQTPERCRDALDIHRLCRGGLHVFSGVDHLAALAPVAVADAQRAGRTGMVWGLGHGIGVEAHEDPYIVAGNERLLEPGMTFRICWMP